MSCKVAARGPQQHAIELPRAQEVGAQRFEAARQYVCQREHDVHEPVEHSDLAEVPAVNVTEAIEQGPDRDDLDDVAEELAQGEHDGRRRIPRLRPNRSADQPGEQMQVRHA